MVRQRSAKPLFPSSNLGVASNSIQYAGVAELADATDLKSVGKKFPYRFDSGPRHQYKGLQSLICKLFYITIEFENIVEIRYGIRQQLIARRTGTTVYLFEG